MTYPLINALQPTVLEQIRLTVVIPTYNEADNLPAMAAALFALPFARLQLLVVDDNSPDGTGQVADELAARLDMDRWSIQPRTSELKRKGLIRDSGQRRPNSTGKLAIVWIAA